MEEGGEGGNRKGGRGTETEGGGQEGGNYTHSAEEGVSVKCERTDKSDTEMNTCTEGGLEVGTFHTRRGT